MPTPDSSRFSPVRIGMFVVGLLAALIACSLWPGGSAEDVVSCDDVQLASNQGQPGDTIEVSGVPQSMTGLYVEVTADDLEVPVESPMLLTPGGGLAVLVPMHPDGLTGGELNMVITNGDRDCPPVTVQVEPIEPAPAGTLDTYVAAVGDNLAAWREDVGVSRQQLLTGHLEPEFIPLAGAQYLYDDPDNPTSLVRIADGTARTESGEQVDRQVLEAVLVDSGLADHVHDFGPPADDTLSDYSVGQLASRYLQRQAAEELSSQMMRQKFCEGLLTGKSGDVLNDVDLSITAIGTASSPLGAFAADLKLAVVWPTQYCAYRLPSHFVSMIVRKGQDEFKEDTDFEADPPTVDSVLVTAESEEWNLSPILIDSLLAAGGNAAAVGELRGTVKSTPFISELNGTLGSVVNNLCGRSDCADDIGVTLPPTNTGPVEIMWPEFVRFTGLRSIGTGEYGEYFPVAIGPGGLRVETLPVFGNGHEIRTYEMNVAQIDLSLDPTSALLAPGETVSFTVNIENAEHPELNSWTLIAPDGQEGEVAHDEVGYTFRAPKITHDADNDPCRKTEIWGILVEATSRTGLRSSGEPPRSANAVITVQEDDPQAQDCATQTPTPTPRPDQCLFGTWSVDPESYDHYIADLLSGGDVTETSAEGTLDVEFRRDWTMTLDMNMALTICSAQGCVTTNTVQSGEGTYSVDTVTSTLTTQGDVPIIASIGETSSEALSGGGSAHYECNADSLIIHPQNAPSLQYNRAD